MKIVKTNLGFTEWMKSMTPPPIKLSKTKLQALTEEQRAEHEKTSERRIIDPCRINQFIDPEKEGLA